MMREQDLQAEPSLHLHEIYWPEKHLNSNYCYWKLCKNYRNIWCAKVLDYGLSGIWFRNMEHKRWAHESDMRQKWDLTAWNDSYARVPSISSSRIQDRVTKIIFIGKSTGLFISGIRYVGYDQVRQLEQPNRMQMRKFYQDTRMQ